MTQLLTLPAKVDMIDEQTGISTSTTYRQQWPFTGHVAQVAVTSGGVVLSNTTNDVRSADVVQANGARTKFVYVADSTTTRTDLDATPLGTVQTHNDYSTDGWASLTHKVVTASGAGKTFTTTVDNTFKPADAGRWIFGLVDTSATTRTSAAGSLTRTVKHTYDDNTGLAVSDIVEPGVEKYQVTTTQDRSNNAFGLVGLVTQRWIDPLTKLEVKRETVTEYDANGRYALKLTKKVAAGNDHVESRTYDSGSGAVLTLTDRNSFKTTYTVDGFGRVQKELRNDNNETRAHLKTCQTGCQPGAAMVRVVESYNGNNRIGVPKVEFSDSVGHLLRSQTWNIDGTVIFAEQEYDSFGRQSRTYHPRDPAKALYLASRTEYDILNRVTKLATVDEGGVERATNTTYNGLSITRTNARGYSRTETRDALGQMERVRDANNKDTKFEYDPLGNLANTTDPNGNVIRVASDLWGRKEMLNDPDLGVIQYTVDPVGRVREQFTARQGTAKKARMEYDLLDRMIGRYEPSISATEPGLESHWVYDTAAYGKGQLAEAFTGTETNKDYYRTHTYDGILGRPKQTTQMIGNTEYSTEQGYDVYGRLESISHRRGANAPKQFSMRYSSAGYLRKVLRGTQMLWEVQSLDPSLRPTKAMLGNGLLQNRDFDLNSGRLKGGNVQLGAALRLAEGYEYDEIGSVKTRNLYWDTGGFHETFGYDSLNRIERSTINAENQVFKYDAAGNITEKNGAIYSYLEQGADKKRPHAVQNVSGLGSYSYDENGNMNGTPTGSITWTAFDMPDRITKVTSKGTVWASFVYGPEHQRTRQMRSDGSDVIYAGAQELETKNGQATVKTYWPNGIGVEIDRPGVTTTELNWSHTDWLGSPVALSDEAGTLREKMSYDAWGRRRNLDGSAANDTLDGVAGVVDNKGFTGHEMLDQLDLVHMNGRVYDPKISRFVSADPLIVDPLDGQNYNRYSYVLNNPTNMTDPTGFEGMAREPVPGSPDPGSPTVCRGAGCGAFIAMLDRKARLAAANYCSGSMVCSKKGTLSSYEAARAKFIAQANASTNPSDDSYYASRASELSAEYRNDIIREATLASPNQYVSQLAPCVGREGTCVAGLASGLGGGWLFGTKLGQAMLALIGIGSEVQGMADGLPPGGSALSAERVFAIRTGDYVERTFVTSKGNVDFLAVAVVKGDRLILDEAVLYAQGKDKVLTGMTRDLYKGFDTLKEWAAKEGFKSLEIKGTRALNSSSKVPGSEWSKSWEKLE